MRLGFMFLTPTNSFDVNFSAGADCLAALGVDVTIYFYKTAPAHVKHAKVKVFGDPFRPRCLLDMALHRADFCFGLGLKPWFSRLAALFGIKALHQKFVAGIVGADVDSLCEERPYQFSTRFKDFHDEYVGWRRAPVDPQAWIVSPTGEIRDYYAGKGFTRGHCLLLPHGVLTDVFRPAAAPHPGFNMMFIGADAVRKGLGYLLRAYEKIRPSFPQANLLIVGRFVVCKEPGVKVIDEALNPAYLTHVPSYFNQADLLVFPSLADGQPIVVLEALASGVPVIATRGIGYDDVIRDGYNGFLVGKRDVNALEEKMRWCLTHPAELKKMRANARKTALEHTWMHSARVFKGQLDALEGNPPKTRDK